VNPPAYVAFERDPEDEMVLNLAIHLEADFIVSKDRDLLDLSRTSGWQTAYPTIRIIPPEELRKEISVWRERREAIHEHTANSDGDPEKDRE
jgi:predicted nucleic acid-binding protein